MEKLTTKRLWDIGKLLISLVILFLIFRKIPFSQVLHNVQQYHFLTILILLLTAYIKQLTQYFNWKWVLHMNPGFQHETNQVSKSYLIGTALSFLAPGGYATFAKVFFIDNTSKKATFFSIVMEKLFLTWINYFVASIAAISLLTSITLSWRIAIVVFIGFIPAIGSIVLMNVKRLQQYYQPYLLYTPRIMISQVIYITLTCIQYWLLLRTFVPISLIHSASATALVLFANTIPITFNGLGLRETFAMYFYQKVGIEASIAVTTSLTIFFINAVLPALIGAYHLIRFKRKH